MAKSKYDELHDLYSTFQTKKKGTKYERLTVMVIKILEERAVVIHDLKLLGESTVKHQIDVTIDVDGKKERTIIECKDFDVSKKPLGLDIVRSFSAVVEDTKPKNAYIIMRVRFERIEDVAAPQCSNVAQQQ